MFFFVRYAHILIAFVDFNSVWNNFPELTMALIGKTYCMNGACKCEKNYNREEVRLESNKIFTLIMK